MNKISSFISSWGYIIFLAILILVGLFTLGCTIYTATASPFVGIVGIVGAIAMLAVLAHIMCKEIKNNIKK